MKPTIKTFARTAIDSTPFEVVTLRLQVGRKVWFETTIVLGDHASDPETSTNAVMALLTHDGVCRSAREVAAA